MKTEQRIQQEIIVYYRNKNIDNDNLIFSVPNDSRNAVEQIRKVATGLMAGVSDLIIVKKNEVIFVEIKDENGKQSEKQKIFEKKIKALGFDYHIVRSLHEFILKKL